MKRVSILGSTGSIGCNTLEVVEHLKDLEVVALAAGRNMVKFAAQIARFRPELVSCQDDECADTLLRELDILGVKAPKLMVGEEG
jgi:1-deoxy-D-xylulose-5-phosphate reductoisomerase